MTAIHPIRIPALAYLTEPEPGIFLLNLQFAEPGITRSVPTLERVQISAPQLRNLAADAVAMALRGEGEAI